VRAVVTRVVLAVTLVAAPAAGQVSPPTDVAAAIDAQVWRPLLAASDGFDADAFLAVQSPDLVRIAEDRDEIYGFERYARETRAGFPRARARGIRRRSEARFLSRSHGDALARDVGIFRSEVTLPDGTVRVSYTWFEMILRQEGGRWRILVDRDSARGGTLTEQDYAKATPLSAPRP
jgi:hypothetical protein